MSQLQLIMGQQSGWHTHPKDFRGFTDFLEPNIYLHIKHLLMVCAVLYQSDYTQRDFEFTRINHEIIKVVWEISTC